MLGLALPWKLDMIHQNGSMFQLIIISNPYSVELLHCIIFASFFFSYLSRTCFENVLPFQRQWDQIGLALHFESALAWVSIICLCWCWQYPYHLKYNFYPCWWSFILSSIVFHVLEREKSVIIFCCLSITFSAFINFVWRSSLWFIVINIIITICNWFSFDC